MSKILHVGLSIRGALKDETLARCITAKDGRQLSQLEIHNILCDLLADGVEMIPIGEPCEGWNWKTGCPGHNTNGA